MTDEKPTLGTGGKKGFQKRQLVQAGQVAVDPDDIARMQQGYETRIARQAEALNRLTDLLEQRTQDVAEHMRRANEAAATVIEGTLGLQRTDISGVLEDAEVDELMKLIPESWDWYHEDDTARTVLAKYIKYCTDEAEHQKAKQEEVVKYYNDHQKVGLYLQPFMGARGIQGEMLMDTVPALIAQLTRDLARAEQDARANAATANAALHAQHVGEIGADAEIPPDMRPGGQSYVAPVDLARTAIPQPLEVSTDADRETLSWSGMEELDEYRPGNSF